MKDNELFELCKEVSDKTGWGEVCDLCRGDGKEHCNNPDHEFVAGAGTDEMQRLGCPTCDFPRNTLVIRGGNCEDCGGTGLLYLYTSDYLLEKLPQFSGGMTLIIAGSSPGNKDWEAGYPFGNTPAVGRSDTPLKALLKLTLALKKAGGL